MRIAVLGSGISGLVSAHLLSRRRDVVLVAGDRTLLHLTDQVHPAKRTAAAVQRSTP